ncbi:hypothetical protein [Mycolicibacterium llatzerense]|uniref:hypothetical protein n=1 Tax=Mycolicibacterium llatzerense TaxID=280871 RepID=UPI0021B4DF5A|nr:hypothetical protein [Mycolicibacterium llatzerense]MCT7372705.1 hypothetical protein [Mycolicibacterium llatzerense]
MIGGEQVEAWGGLDNYRARAAERAQLNHHATLNKIRQSARELLDLCESNPERVRPVVASMPDHAFAYILAGLRYPDDDHRLNEALNRANLLRPMR